MEEKTETLAAEDKATAENRNEIAYRVLYGLIAFVLGTLACFAYFAAAKGINLKDVGMVSCGLAVFAAMYVFIMIGHPACVRDKCLLVGVSLVSAAALIALAMIARL